MNAYQKFFHNPIATVMCRSKQTVLNLALVDVFVNLAAELRTSVFHDLYYPQ